MTDRIHRVVRLVIFSIFCLHHWGAEASVSISVQQGNQTVSVGEEVHLSATFIATAGEVAESFQWFRSASVQGPFTVVGGGTDALILTNVQTSDAGYYFVTVTYDAGGSVQSDSSGTVRLVVNLQPRIAVQPASIILPVGSNAVFSVLVGGAPPLHLQWRKDGANLVNDGRVTGTTGTSLEIDDLTAADAGDYDLFVWNSYGSATSQVATLGVYLAPPVFNSPTNAVGKQGYAFNYTISAIGTAPITYGASGLPDGLAVDSTNGVISGVPSVAGVFEIALFATNLVQTNTENLQLTLADDIPVITSATNAAGMQGQSFTYAITATNDPVSFTAMPLPLGLSLDTNSGVISGVPLVSGSFPMTIGVANAYGSNSEILTLDLASGAPSITSSLAKNGTQGQFLSYTIKTHNTTDLFSAGPLPDGLSLNPTNGVISGIPLVNGAFPVVIGAMNEFGADSQTLTFNLAGSVPVITSSLNVRDVEELPNFNYAITASHSPTVFWALNLPTGLTVNTNTGDITGAPLYAGNYSVPLFAANAWGVGTATLQLSITNRTITTLVITNLTTHYLSPYLLDFRFSLLDGYDSMTSHAVVASPTLMTVSAFEDGVPVSPSETAVLLQPVDSEYADVLKGYLVMDFSASIASLANGDTNGNGISDAVDAEVGGAENFVNEQPFGSQIGVYEFHRDDEPARQVMPLTTDTNALDGAIAGIWNNDVQGFPAGSQSWDALAAAINALGTSGSNEIHYVVFMSDGWDDSSVATMPQVIAAATNAGVRIYTVGFGSDINTDALSTLASSTMGQYFTPTNASDLALDFARLGKDLRSQYVLRWATLSRGVTNSFMPTFQITYQGLTAQSPPNPPPFIVATNFVTVTNAGVAMTNAVYLYHTNYIIPSYSPSLYAGNVLAGSLLLVSNADLNPLEITLDATYVPRYIRQVHLHYRANAPVTVDLDSTNPGEILYGWTLTQTNDGAGGQWALLSAPDPTLLADSIPFAAFGDLLTFSFPDSITASNAFSEFEVDNTIYTNTATTNFYGFNLAGTNFYTTVYAVLPPHGTPIPWLMNYGFTNNFAAAELLDPNGNGLAVWQDYLAGLDPLDTNSTFATYIASSANPPQIVFNTVVGRTYRIDWSLSPYGGWKVLRDGIAGTGGDVTFTDERNLTDVPAMYYRVVVEGP